MNPNIEYVGLKKRKKLNDMEKKFDLEERLIDFVLILDEIIEQLPNTRLANHLAGQMVRSGTSPALNY